METDTLLTPISGIRIAWSMSFSLGEKQKTEFVSKESFWTISDFAEESLSHFFPDSITLFLVSRAGLFLGVLF